jgi:hypothetical protein
MESVIEQPKRSNLLLHCGARAVDLQTIREVETPEPTETWTPIPHIDLIDQVSQTLLGSGLTIVNTAHSLTHDGMRYFGLMQIKNGSENEDYAWVLGLRNSHDKVFPAGLVAGASVFICDNLSFSGEIRFARKHTRFITRDLPQLTSRAIGKLIDKWNLQDKRIDAYKEKELGDMQAHDLIIKSVDVRACTTTQIPKILNEWRHPEFEEFKERTTWSLFNGFTRVLNQGENLNELSRRTEALHGLLDSYVGLPQFSQN